MKILLFGAEGQLGSQLRTTLAALGEVVAPPRSAGGDVTDAPGVERLVRAHSPGAIVNASAYTAVDRAESEREAAFAVNARACETLARAAQGAGAWLVHYSTDYVFDGSGTRPWREDDPTAPLNVYGESKLAGEAAVRAHCERHLVLRTSWVFSATGRNFVTAILGAARTRDALTVVDDQWGAPAGVRLLADVTNRLLATAQPAQAGLYHCAPAGFTSRLTLARFIVERGLAEGLPLRARPESILGARTADTPSPARRPLNSRLDCTRLVDTFGIELAPWEAEVRVAIAEFAGSAVR